MSGCSGEPGGARFHLDVNYDILSARPGHPLPAGTLTRVFRLIRSPRVLAALAGIAALFVMAMLVPLPGPQQIRDWAGGAGPLLPVLFFLFYALVAVAPVPRTVLTVTSGVLFGPVLGSLLALGATGVSATLALLGVRAVGRGRVAEHLHHPAVRAIDDRLAQRGWLAVAALRMIPMAPFSIVNYCCGLSSVRVAPYLLATVVGSAPGTISTVILAGSLAGGTDPLAVTVSALCLSLGLIGLVVDARMPVAKAGEPTGEPLPVRG
ncbi:putative membrane protein YdjX (TVP38/TMEM64 family) [Nocardia neocaledoniensis]|uniref:TVP38/TMEM64 family membrane protein n=1 Tax=Nocardia neocaledoniensis TaxID=236511 RepID=A0A317NI08_9NOCA|nr:putative membrane protein YdjX (TVP38/TMEM64 family) [Nocardia neocaledoniensis]